MDVPSRYGILIPNQKDPTKTARYSFNGYDKKQLFKQLVSSWEKNESEMSFNILIENFISLYFKDLLIHYINYIGDNALIHNIKYCYRLNKILKKYKDIQKSMPKRGIKMFLVNSSEMRNLFAELNSDIFTFKKTTHFTKKNLSNNCFSEENIARNSKLTHIDALYDKEDKEIPPNLSRGIQEILHRIDNYFNEDFIDNTYHWLCWLLKAEKRDRKLNPKKVKELVFIEPEEGKKNKFTNDWFIYFTKKIVSKSKSCKSTSTKVLVKSIIDIIKFEYNSSHKKDRLSYLTMAIYLIHKDKDISLTLPVNNMNIYSVLNINKFFETIIPVEERKNYQKQYEEIRDELFSQRILEKDEKERTKNYKKAKLNDKMDYLNMIFYKDAPKEPMPKGKELDCKEPVFSRKITDYF